MKFIRVIGSLLPLALLLPALCLGQGAAEADDIAKLREQLAAQQKLIDQQRQALESAQRAIDAQQKLLDRLVAARSAPAAAATQAAAALPAKPATPAADVDAKGRAFSPLAFHIGGADFAPGGFMDFSTVWRSTNVGSGVATSFGAVPFSNTAAGRMQEFRSSATNSRVTLTITENPTKNLAVTGYLEVDFTGNQPAGMWVTSNSSTMRMRHFWVNVQRKKWELLGGQTWSLMIPNRSGVNSSNVFLGFGEDANYLPGLIWVRPGQFRIVYHPNKHWSIATSIENPEQYVTPSTTLPGFATTQVDNGNVPSTPNARPDIVAKIAYDTQVSGKAFHFELAGFSRRFRTSPAPGEYFNAHGVGGSFNTSLEVAKNFRLIANSFYSSGGGRYAVGLGPDLIVGPDGSISPVHSATGIAGVEYAPKPKSQFFGYYAGAYFQRNYTVVSPGNYLGFGFPGSSSANRRIQEPTFGYAYTFWKDPKFGALQMFTQYAYLTRAPWYVAPGTPDTAHAHMVFGSLRFTLP
ncbi:MAG: hypothetical protein NTW28_15580 [Candidatus Solibacter sp.]|nr:hypothetical protein [Candidatus Solibacter sp.]